ncbi:MAG: ROK family protein [Enterococcus sp.]
MISDKFKIREQNEATILSLIIKHEPISRIELARESSLNKATVSSIITKFLDNQFIMEVGSGNSTVGGGRKPTLLQFNKHSGISLSIDAGYNYIEGTATFLDGTIIQMNRIEDILFNSNTREHYIHETLSKILSDLPSAVHGIIGLTISIHGVVHDNEFIFSPEYDLDTYSHLPQTLEEHYGFPVFIENEANLAALGEYTFASDTTNLLTISIGKGIGAGFIQNGKLTTGFFGKFGEIGHQIIYPNGKLCPCGNHGCLEMYTSAEAILNDFKKLKNLEIANETILAEFYKMGDKETIQLLKDKALLLATGINNVISILDPEVLSISSKLTTILPELIDEIRHDLTGVLTEDVQLKHAELKDQAILYGSLANNLIHSFNLNELKFPIKNNLEN